MSYLYIQRIIQSRLYLGRPCVNVMGKGTLPEPGRMFYSLFLRPLGVLYLPLTFSPQTSDVIPVLDTRSLTRRMQSNPLSRSCSSRGRMHITMLEQWLDSLKD